MLLRTKIYTLVVLSSAGQILAFGSFSLLENRRQKQESELSHLAQDLERIQEIRLSFSEIASAVSAAAITSSIGEIRSLYGHAYDLDPSIRMLAGYGSSRALSARYEEYLQAVNVLLQNTSSQRHSGLSLLLAQLRQRDSVALRSIQDIREEVAALLAHRRQVSVLTLARLKFLLYACEGVFVALLLGMATFWIMDMRRAFGMLKRDLAFVGRGEAPPKWPQSRRDEVGEMIGVLHQVAYESKSLRETMVRWDRLAAMGQLAGGVAHEMNNPLVGVLGQAELLLQDLPQEDPGRRQVERIIASAQRCRKIVRNLLDFASPKSHEFTHVDLREAWDCALGIVSSDLKSAGIEVKSYFELDLPFVWGSHFDISEVFLNLILNAKDAMLYGGTLELSVERQTPPQLKPQAGFWVRILLKDNGSGIPKETLGRLFEAFFTTKEPGKGTGLGLSVCHGIIKNHGGSIEVQSDGPGKGATFTIFLPVSVQIEVAHG